MADHRLDVLGEMCPIPVLKAQQILNKMSEQETLTVITDHSCVESNLRHLFIKKGHKVLSNEVMNGVWEVEIVKQR